MRIMGSSFPLLVGSKLSNPALQCLFPAMHRPAASELGGGALPPVAVSQALPLVALERIDLPRGCFLTELLRASFVCSTGRRKRLPCLLVEVTMPAGDASSPPWAASRAGLSASERQVEWHYSATTLPTGDRAPSRGAAIPFARSREGCLRGSLWPPSTLWAWVPCWSCPGQDVAGRTPQGQRGPQEGKGGVGQGGATMMASKGRRRQMVCGELTTHWGPGTTGPSCRREE